MPTRALLMRKIRELVRLKHQEKLSHEALDRPAPRPLLVGRYESAWHSTAKVSIDHHFAVDEHFYSVPHALVQQSLEVRSTAGAPGAPRVVAGVPGAPTARTRFCSARYPLPTGSTSCCGSSRSPQGWARPWSAVA